MALPLPMLSVLLSTLFACSLAFRDCKKTRNTISNGRGILMAKQRGGSHGVQGEVFGVGVCWCVCEGESERDWGSDGRSEGLCSEQCVEKLNNTKKKVSKEAQKLTDKQNSVTKSSNTDVQVQKKRDQTKTTPDTFQHRGDQRRPHIESWLSPETLWGSFHLFETQSGPLVGLQTNCCYTHVVSAVPLP